MKTLDNVLFQSIKPTILVAEDDPDQSDSLREIFEDEGYLVETVFSGDMALQRLKTHSFAAAIMDARMPGLHGGTVLKVCHLGNPQVSTPIIMVSAFASPRDSNQYREDGAVASFTKPLDTAQVVKFVRQLVENQHD